MKDMFGKPIFLKNYDYGKGWSSMHKFKSIKEFLASKRKKKASLEEIMFKYGSRLSDLQEKNPNLKEDIKELSEADPSGKDKYLNVAVKWLKQGYILNEIKEAINLFHKNIAKLDNKDLDSYDFLKLLPLLDRIDSTYSKSEEKKIIKSTGGIKIFEDEQCLVLDIKSKGAACFYGSNTKWCITMATRDYENYKALNDLFFFVLRKDLEQIDPLYKIAMQYRKTFSDNDARQGLLKIQCYDANDSRIGIREALAGLTNKTTIINLINSLGERLPDTELSLFKDNKPGLILHQRLFELDRLKTFNEYEVAYENLISYEKMFNDSSKITKFILKSNNMIGKLVLLDQFYAGNVNELFGKDDILNKLLEELINSNNPVIINKLLSMFRVYGVDSFDANLIENFSESLDFNKLKTSEAQENFLLSFSHFVSQEVFDNIYFNKLKFKKDEHNRLLDTLAGIKLSEDNYNKLIALNNIDVNKRLVFNPDMTSNNLDALVKIITSIDKYPYKSFVLNNILKHHNLSEDVKARISPLKESNLKHIMKKYAIDFAIDEQITPILEDNSMMSQVAPAGELLTEPIMEPDADGKSMDKLNFSFDLYEPNVAAIINKYMNPMESSLNGMPNDYKDSLEELDAVNTISGKNPYYHPTEEDNVSLIYPVN